MAHPANLDQPVNPPWHLGAPGGVSPRPQPDSTAPQPNGMPRDPRTGGAPRPAGPPPQLGGGSSRRPGTPGHPGRGTPPAWAHRPGQVPAPPPGSTPPSVGAPQGLGRKMLAHPSLALLGQQEAGGMGLPPQIGGPGVSQSTSGPAATAATPQGMTQLPQPSPFPGAPSFPGMPGQADPADPAQYKQGIGQALRGIMQMLPPQLAQQLVAFLTTQSQQGGGQHGQPGLAPPSWTPSGPAGQPIPMGPPPQMGAQAVPQPGQDPNAAPIPGSENLPGGAPGTGQQTQTMLHHLLQPMPPPQQPLHPGAAGTQLPGR